MFACDFVRVKGGLAVISRILFCWLVLCSLCGWWFCEVVLVWVVVGCFWLEVLALVGFVIQFLWVVWVGIVSCSWVGW